MNREKRVCKAEECTGCLACYNSCPFDAIVMKTDKKGFCFPIITDACRACGKCESVCPVLKPLVKRISLKCYAAVSEKASLHNSTSGGIASLLYEFIIGTGGVGYGVCFDQDCRRFVFKKAEKQIDALKFSGSKYVQADVGAVYKRIKQDLQAGIRVLFVATPCQIAGLEKFLQIDYSNLLLVDIICHGVPSQKMLFDCLQLNESDCIEHVIFRKGKKYVLDALISNGKSICIDSYHSKYYEAYSLGKSIRESCHNCQYASSKRVGNMTIGDFWGLGKDSCLFRKQENFGGVSMVLCNDEKGVDLFEKIKHNLKYEERSVFEAVSGNSQLRYPVSDTKASKRFRKLYECSGNFEYAVIHSRNIRQILSSISLVHYCTVCARKIWGLLKV